MAKNQLLQHYAWHNYVMCRLSHYATASLSRSLLIATGPASLAVNDMLYAVF